MLLGRFFCQSFQWSHTTQDHSIPAAQIACRPNTWHSEVVQKGMIFTSSFDSLACLKPPFGESNGNPIIWQKKHLSWFKEASPTIDFRKQNSKGILQSSWEWLNLFHWLFIFGWKLPIFEVFSVLPPKKSCLVYIYIFMYMCIYLNI